MRFSNQKQIAHREAIPWLEFQKNPYTVLCTTTLGGHLSWFETGGTRWFAKPVGKPFILQTVKFAKNPGLSVSHENGRRSPGRKARSPEYGVRCRACGYRCHIPLPANATEASNDDGSMITQYRTRIIEHRAVIFKASKPSRNGSDCQIHPKETFFFGFPAPFLSESPSPTSILG